MARHETPWGAWDPLTPAEVRHLLAGLDARWWIAGGYAIEAFVGRTLREHDDVDVGLLHRDQSAIQCALPNWELHAADPPATLRPWLPGELLPLAVHDIWAREDAHAPWRLQFMLNDAHATDWVFRRDPRLRAPLDRLTWSMDGTSYLAPEIQLLFKSKGRRPKDEVDFEATLPMLDSKQLEWLRAALTLVDPTNPWLTRLSEPRA